MGRKGSLELFLATILVVWSSVVPAACQTAYVVASQQADYNPENHTFNTLASAAANPGYDVILLVGDFVIKIALWSASNPLRRTRNLTISSFDYAEQSYAVLDLEFLEARFLVAANTTVLLKDVAVGRARKSSGQQLPFFAGEGQHSIIELQNVPRLRTACANDSYALAAALVEGFRSGPGETGQGSNLAYVETFKWRGQLYPDSLHADDVSTFAIPGDLSETHSIDAGYTLLQQNVTRVCLAYADPACVAQRGGDACVIALVDQILASESSGGGGHPLATIVAPVAIAGVLLPAAVVGFLLYRRNRRRRVQQQLLPDTEKGLRGQQHQQQVALLPGSGGGPGSGSDGARYATSKDDERSSDAEMPGPRGGASGSLEALAVGGAKGGWKLLACHTSPEFKDATPNDRIKLGVLLGAGSFGRVYKGRWHNMDVAVKVLQHDSTTAAVISNEVDLVMSFRHPNIVAAYHFVTWTQQSPDDEGGAPQGRNRSRLMPVEESMYGDGAVDRPPTNPQSDSSFPRPPAVVIAGRDGSTMSSLPTVCSPEGPTCGPGTAAGTNDTTHSNNSGSSSSNVQAMMAVLGNSRERNAISGTNGNNSNNSGLGRASGSSLLSNLNPASTSSHVAQNPSSGAGHFGQGLVIPLTREGSGTSGLDSGLGFNASPVSSSHVPGSSTLRREGSSGLRFNSHGSNTMSTGSSTAAVAAILAAGRHGTQTSSAVTARTPLLGSQLRPKSPASAAAAAAAVGAAQAGSTPFGAQSLQQNDGSKQQQHLSGVSKVSDEMIVGTQTPSRSDYMTDKLAASKQTTGIAGATGDPAADQLAAAGLAVGSSSGDVSPHGVNLQLPASALRQPRNYGAASNAAASASLSPGAGSGEQQQRRQEPGNQRSSGFETSADPVVKPLHSKSGLDGSTMARLRPGVSETPAVTHFVPFTPGQLLEYERSGTTGSNSRSASALQSPSGATAAAAAGSAAQPNSRSQSGASVAAAAAAAGAKPLPTSRTVSGITTPATPDHILQQQQQQQQQPASGSDQASCHTPHWHTLGNFSNKDAKPPSGAATAAAAPPLAATGSTTSSAADPAAVAAATSPVVPQPANFDGGGMSSGNFSSLGRPVARGSAGRQLAEAQTWLILEYCNGGTLLDLLQDGQLSGHQVPSPTSKRKHAFMLTLLSDVATGMLYLHRRNVLHGDLKPGNILIRYESGLPYGRAAKVSDFGLSRALNVGQSHRSTRTMGTMNHTPPELLRLGRLSPAGDVYAFGIIMWEVFTGKVAFHGLHYGELFEQVALWQKRPPVPDDMPKDYAELMTDCWAADSFQRPTFDVIETSLKEMLARVVQDEKEAQDRFVSDL